MLRLYKKRSTAGRVNGGSSRDSLKVSSAMAEMFLVAFFDSPMLVPTSLAPLRHGRAGKRAAAATGSRLRSKRDKNFFAFLDSPMLLSTSPAPLRQVWVLKTPKIDHFGYVEAVEKTIHSRAGKRAATGSRWPRSKRDKNFFAFLDSPMLVHSSPGPLRHV
ncbi:hypothetical protein ACOMHN_056992 [Nucella lapillus]